MARKRKKRRLRAVKRHFGAYSGRYLVGLVCVGMLAVGIWFAGKPPEAGDDEPFDFGDRQSSGKSRELSRASFDDALKLDEDGDREAAVAVMQRLAPLSDGAEEHRGNPAAHLWMAKHLLGGYDAEFLGRFPVSYHRTNFQKAPPFQRDEGDIKKIVSHLEHAASLDPGEAEASLLLASVLVATGNRNEGVGVLLDAMGHTPAQLADMLIFMVNATVYEGDDIALEEQAWHRFSTLGRDLSKGRGNVLGGRVQYGACALLLQKPDVVAASVKRIGRDFEGTRAGAKASEAVNGLNMAGHYYAAVRSLDAAHREGDYSKVADEVSKAFLIMPAQEHLVQALEALVKKQPSLKSEISELLQQAAKDGKQGGLTLRKGLLLVSLSDDANQKRGYLEQLQKEFPENGKVVLDLLRLRFKQSASGHQEMLRLLGAINPDELLTLGDKGEFYKLLGQLRFKAGSETEAIAALEKALPMVQDRREVHAALAQAYRKLGHVKMAERHVTKAKD